MKYLWLLLAVLLIGVISRPAHAADAYPMCPLKAGLCAPQLPTLNQCDALVKGIQPTPAQLHDEADYVPIDRAVALAGKNVCYGQDRPLFLTEDDIEPARQTMWKMNNSIAFANGGSAYNISAHTFTSNRKVWAFVKVKDAAGKWIVDANLPPALYPVTADIIGAHWGDLMRKGVRSMVDPLRFSPHLALKVATIGSGVTSNQVPDFVGGLQYNINQDFAIGYGAFVRNCSGSLVLNCNRKMDTTFFIDFDATRAAATYLLGTDIAIRAGSQAIRDAFKAVLSPFDPFGK